MAFKAGDQVSLISGGPTMTVIATSGYERVLCTWHSHSADAFKQENFPPAALRLIPKLEPTAIEEETARFFADIPQ
ncbi:YodC family protein [Oceanisphaera sp. W20_SRM_FM3]|uniref:YodC family protein n=1 Tax=Oceanisphaera sp. W20_SRM_FM3 TaxID=3240267 RepID=UPI003F96006B